MLDCIIVGSGPAGLSAALNLKILHKDFMWFGSNKLSDKMLKADKIVNYPGFPLISGEDLTRAFKEHLESFALEITEKTVTNISSAGDIYCVLADNELYETKTVILATGVVNQKALENEDELLGRGVSYCATCDGNFFRGKKIAVITNDEKFEHEVDYLSDIVKEVIYFPSFVSKLKKDNLIISKEIPISINGETKVESLTLKNGETIELDGVFCLRNAIAPTKLMPELEVDKGHIIVDRKMATNLKGVYACGDCTGIPYQFAKAIGEGNVAAHSVVTYLAKKDK